MHLLASGSEKRLRLVAPELKRDCALLVDADEDLRRVLQPTLERAARTRIDGNACPFSEQATCPAYMGLIFR